ncbi:MAG TPA: TonB-dependent receptor plug domain-containing protein, partial [Cyclobacteriaceae bacterium]|nr:TonB-dependent receptor plug domain-containing protein [Cyclobacteriaceae bacterium]
LFCILITKFAKTQDLDSLLNLSAYTEESELQKNLNKGLTVSSSKALSTRETPGIISLITAEEIQNAGARDLTDILRLVPGFDVGQDLQFVLGIGLRGNWANEGKVMVLMDGQPFNELLYQSVAIGNRFPVDAIEQIEIIRGPGSAIYGGSAEYGVINIKTKAAESLNGVAVYGTGGFHADAVGRTNGGVMVSRKNDNISWDASFFRGKGIVSDQKNYQDLYKDSTVQNLAKTTMADPMNLNFGLRYKGLSARAMYDYYKTSDPFLYIFFKNFSADIKYSLKVNPKITVVPQLKYYHQIPWSWGDRRTKESYFEIKAERLYSQLEMIYDVSRKINLNFGGIYFEDKGTDLLEGSAFHGNKTLTLQNFAIFGQGLLKHRLVNATIGFRYEKNNRYGSAFVPRVGLTKKIENFHFKILYCQAFRAPSIQNINKAATIQNNDVIFTDKIKPEKSDVAEIEIGYQFTPEMLFTVNVFSMTTKRILTYGSRGMAGVDFIEWYTNATKSGSRGFEVIYSIRKKVFYANLTYSFSNAIKIDSTLQTYKVPQTSRQYAGMLMNKVTLNTNVNLIKNITFNSSFIYGGKRYAYTTIDANGDPASNKLNPYLLVNGYLNYKNVVPGLTVGAGVYDILNQRPAIPQAYNGGYAPVPIRSREFVVKAYYQFNFKK